MISLELEIESLRARLGDRATDALLARERRKIFSIHPELQISGWLGATLLAAAAGVFLKSHLDRIGPVVLSLLIALAAIACYAWTWWRRARPTPVDDYVLLLGALLVSADVAFVESQFHLLDDVWKHHLLILAVVHAIGAYAYGSRTVLSLSIAALAGWFGVDKQRAVSELALPAFEVSALLVAWRALDARLHGPMFSRTLEHSAAVIALLGCLTLLESGNEIVAGALTIAVAAGIIAWGFRTRGEAFVLYGLVFIVIGADAILLELTDGAIATWLVLLLSLVGGIAALLALHARFREAAA